MKLYTGIVAMLSSVACLFIAISFSMDQKKALMLCLANNSGSFQKNITEKQASFSPRLQSFLEKGIKKHVFDPFLNDDAIKMFGKYMEAYDSNEMILVDHIQETFGKIFDEPIVHTRKTFIPKMLLIEREIPSKKFDILSDLLLIAEQYSVDALGLLIKKTIVSKILKNHDLLSKEVVVSFKVMKDSLRKHPKEMIASSDGIKDVLVDYSKLNHNEIFSIPYEKKICDVTVSPDAKHMVVTSHTHEKNFLGTFYTCCDNATMLKMCGVDRSNDAFIFTPDSKFCIVCSGKSFKILDCNGFFEVATFNADPQDPYCFFVMSPNGCSLLVTTLSGKGCLYERVRDTGMFELSRKEFNVRYDLMKPVFTPDSKELWISQGKTLCRYDVATGKELAIIKSGNRAFEQICIHPHGEYVAVITRGKCRIYKDYNFEKLLLTFTVDIKGPARPFFSKDGKLFAVASGSKCFVVACSGDSLEPYARECNCLQEISQATFFGDMPYLMVSDGVTCDIYDCHAKKCIQQIDLMCLGGAKIVVSDDGSYLVITCENTSTMYAMYSLKPFFKLMGDALEQKKK